MKTPKLRVTGFCEGNQPVAGGFPSQRACNTENVSIWWRHHAERPSKHCNTHRQSSDGYYTICAETKGPFQYQEVDVPAKWFHDRLTFIMEIHFVEWKDGPYIEKGPGGRWNVLSSEKADKTELGLQNFKNIVETPEKLKIWLFSPVKRQLKAF